MDGQKDWQSNLSKPPGPLLSRKVASAHKEKQLAQVSDFRAASFSYVCVCVCVCVALCFLSFDALEIKLPVINIINIIAHCQAQHANVVWRGSAELSAERIPR